MHHNKATCDRSTITRFLRDDLTDAERAIFEEHLEVCDECRVALEHSAAEPELWIEARESLTSEGASRDRLLDSSQTGADDRAALRSESAARSEIALGFLAPTDDPRMLGRFGGYEIAGVIGSGGFGIVLKGLDVALGRYVAIKVLAPHLATSAAARMRFAREAKAAAAVVHENVIAIHAVAEAGGLPYLVMPYIRGSSLQKRLDAQGPLSVPEILRIGMQTAGGLAAAHAQGLVHRDIKPANILLEDGVERLKITDFGLARTADEASLTRSGVIAGTPQFMSPEQARGEAIDGRSDLFSLGSVLYTACTGHVPFRAETSFGILRRITDESPRPIRELNPEVPPWLCALIDKLHAKDPAGRYQSADEVAKILEQCLAHAQQPDAVPLPAGLRLAGRLSKGARPRVAATVSAASLLVLAAVTYALWDKPPGGDQSGSDAAGSPKNTASANDAAGPSAATAWNDSAEEQITGLDGDVDRLEARARALWDDDAFNSTSTAWDREGPESSKHSTSSEDRP